MYMYSICMCVHVHISSSKSLISIHKYVCVSPRGVFSGGKKKKAIKFKLSSCALFILKKQRGKDEAE